MVLQRDCFSHQNFPASCCRRPADWSARGPGSARGNTPALLSIGHGRGTSRGTLLTVLGARSTRPAVATVSGAPVRSAAASAASASSAAARPASFLRGAHAMTGLTLMLCREPPFFMAWK